MLPKGGRYSTPRGSLLRDRPRGGEKQSGLRGITIVIPGA